MWSLSCDPGTAVDRIAGDGEHPVADPADLDDERVERDRADAALDRGDHAAITDERTRAGALGGPLLASIASRTARS